MDKNRIQLSVVIPLHNESDNVEILTTEIIDALTGRYHFEIIYVDDGSTDQTTTQLKKLKHRQPCLRVFRHTHRCGQSSALRTGVQRGRAPIIVTLDGDLQNDPSDIPQLVEALNYTESVKTLSMVAGYRKHRHDTRWRRLTSKLANAVRSRVLKDHTPDTGCGLKVFCRDVFLSLPYFENMHRFLPALVQRSGGKVISMPVNHRPRIHGRSHYGTMGRLAAGIVDLFGVSWLMARARQPMIEEVFAEDES